MGVFTSILKMSHVEVMTFWFLYEIACVIFFQSFKSSLHTKLVVMYGLGNNIRVII